MHICCYLCVADEKTVMAESRPKMHEPAQVHQNIAVPKCGTGRNTGEAKSGDEEECKEEKEDAAKFRAPIELLAEVWDLFAHHFIVITW